MKLYIVVYHDPLDGSRTAVIALQADNQGLARAKAAEYFSDWNFNEEYTVVTVTQLDLPLGNVVYIDLGDQ